MVQTSVAPVDLIPERLRAHVRTAAQLAEDSDALAGAGWGTLPVSAALAPLLPRGAFERGRTYGCTGDAPLSLMFGLVAAATREGSWLALVDMPHAGLLAAHEHGVALERTLCVETGAGEGRADRWTRVTGALLDGIDIVVVDSPTCSPADARRVASRAKSAGSVLVVTGNPGAFVVDVSLRARTRSWGFDLHAHARTVEVRASGRRVHGAPSCVIDMPPAQG